jgi:hypothetical protein
MARICLTLLMSGCAWLAPTRSLAADADATARAVLLFQAGRDAMKRGAYVAACPKFAASQALAPALGTLLNLALCQEQLGRTATASLAFEKFLARAAADDERRALVAEHLAALRPHAPQLNLRLGSTEPRHVRIALDGRLLSADELTQPILLDPGTHAIATSRPGQPTREATLALADGQVEVRTLASLAPQPQQPPREEVAASTRVPAYVVGGVGVLGLLTGAVTGLMILDERSVVAEHCRAELCDAQGLRANATGRALLVVNAIALGIGAVGVAGGVYLYVSSQASHAAPGGGQGGAPQTRVARSFSLGVAGAF